MQFCGTLNPFSTSFARVNPNGVFFFSWGHWASGRSRKCKAEEGPIHSQECGHFSYTPKQHPLFRGVVTVETPQMSLERRSQKAKGKCNDPQACFL